MGLQWGSENIVLQFPLGWNVDTRDRDTDRQKADAETDASQREKYKDTYKQRGPAARSVNDKRC